MTRNPYDDNTTLWAASLNTIHNGVQQELIESGATPSKGSNDWDTDIASGDVFVNGTEASVSSQTVTHTQPGNDADMGSGDSRIDLVTINDSGTAAITEGSAAADPASPDIPANEVCVAQWHIANGDSTLADADLTDTRVVGANLQTELTFESGTGSVSAGTDTTTTWTVSFNNAYSEAVVGGGACVDEGGTSSNYNDFGDSGLVDTTTDGSGNVNGVKFQAANSEGGNRSVTYFYNVAGEVA